MKEKTYLFLLIAATVMISRQQIEDLEGKTKSMKDQMKKKDENERKYQGKRVSKQVGGALCVASKRAIVLVLKSPWVS